MQLASGRVRELGTKRLGVDGAAYSPGACADLATGGSCVIVRNSAAIAGSRDVRTRGPGGRLAPGPLPGEGRATRRGRGWPGVRAVREEQVLAWLMRHPRDGGTSMLADPGHGLRTCAPCFTRRSDRCGTGTASRRGREKSSSVYESQLLRAPAWGSGRHRLAARPPRGALLPPPGRDARDRGRRLRGGPDPGERGCRAGGTTACPPLRGHRRAACARSAGIRRSAALAACAAARRRRHRRWLASACPCRRFSVPATFALTGRCRRWRTCGDTLSFHMSRLTAIY